MNFPSSNLNVTMLVGLLLSTCVSHAAFADDARPNILFIITDDQERREFNFLPEGRDEQGKPRNLSPNLDRLAAEGIVFPNQYVTSPVCTPSRFSVLTGTYDSRSSTFAKTAKVDGQVNITWNSHLDPETPNLASTLKQAGYFTGAVGKNHVIEVKGVGRDGGPDEDADVADPDVSAYYAEKQRKLVDAFKSCGFDYAASLYHGKLLLGVDSEVPRRWLSSVCRAQSHFDVATPVYRSWLSVANMRTKKAPFSGRR